MYQTRSILCGEGICVLPSTFSSKVVYLLLHFIIFCHAGLFSYHTSLKILLEVFCSYSYFQLPLIKAFEGGLCNINESSTVSVYKDCSNRTKLDETKWKIITIDPVSFKFLYGPMTCLGPPLTQWLLDDLERVHSGWMDGFYLVEGVVLIV